MLVEEMNISRRILILDKSNFIHLYDKYFRTEGVHGIVSYSGCQYRCHCPLTLGHHVAAPHNLPQQKAAPSPLPDVATYVAPCNLAPPQPTPSTSTSSVIDLDGSPHFATPSRPASFSTVTILAFHVMHLRVACRDVRHTTMPWTWMQHEDDMSGRTTKEWGDEWKEPLTK
jgi:hypothetical protein